MRFSNLKLFLLVTSLFSIASAADEAIKCDAENKCPEDQPCCNQFGTCGTGAHCLGGCHPAFSFKTEACMPMPICKSGATQFGDKNALKSIDNYLGDAGETDWVYSGYIEDYNGASILAMPKNTAGTVLSSTRYVWYGKVGATLKTSRGAGVVTAFILFSNPHDEIDFEFVGTNLTDVETNYYYQGVLNYTNGRSSKANNTYENYHDYEFEWTETQITWYVDGQVVRTLKKEDTWNATAKVYQYPQTPSRVQISLWPAGSASSAVGTIQWAGGEIDWDSEDIQKYGYYYVLLKSAYINCYSPPKDTVIKGNVSYIFNSDTEFDQENIEISDEETVLGSLKDSGLNPNVSSSSSSSASSSASSSSSSASSSASSSSSSSSSSSKSSSSSSSSSLKSSSTEKDEEKTTTSTTSSATPTTSSTSSTSSIPAVTGFAQFSANPSVSASVSSKTSAGSGSVNAISTFLSVFAGVFSLFTL